MIDPLPNCFSIWPTARSTAFRRSRSVRSSHSIGGMRAPLFAGLKTRATCLMRAGLKGKHHTSDAGVREGSRHSTCSDGAALSGPRSWAILETCRAKVKGKTVKSSSELTEMTSLTAVATFAPLTEKLQILPSYGPDA